MKFGQLSASPWQRPYLIAEIGVNHEGSIARAEQMIYDVAEAGGDAVKFQAYKAERLASQQSPTYFTQTGEQAPSQFEFFKRYDVFERKDYERLAKIAERAGVDFLCTPFDVETVAWLDPLVPAFKIASADLTFGPLIDRIIQTGKPILLSTGASTLAEVQAVVKHIPNRLILLQCTLSYPCLPQFAQLGVIPALAKQFPQCLIGYSDHVPWHLELLTTAWLIGARAIEKHYTVNKEWPGNDHAHAMTKDDLSALVQRIDHLLPMLGTGSKVVQDCEADARKYARRSWHVTRDIPSGTVLKAGDVALKRPGSGLPPEKSPVGKAVKRALQADQAVMADALV